MKQSKTLSPSEEPYLSMFLPIINLIRRQKDFRKLRRILQMFESSKIPLNDEAKLVLLKAFGESGDFLSAKKFLFALPPIIDDPRSKIIGFSMSHANSNGILQNEFNRNFLQENSDNTSKSNNYKTDKAMQQLVNKYLLENHHFLLQCYFAHGKINEAMAFISKDMIEKAGLTPTGETKKIVEVACQKCHRTDILKNVQHLFPPSRL